MLLATSDLPDVLCSSALIPSPSRLDFFCHCQLSKRGCESLPDFFVLFGFGGPPLVRAGFASEVLCSLAATFAGGSRWFRALGSDRLKACGNGLAVLCRRSLVVFATF
jgi:hypothetical protein